MGDPKRLLEGPALEGLERRLLEGGSDVDPPDDAREVLWGAVAARVALTGATATAISKASAGVSSAAARAGAGVKAAATSAILKPALLVVAAVGISAAALTYPKFQPTANVSAPRPAITSTGSGARLPTAPTPPSTPAQTVSAPQPPLPLSSPPPPPRIVSTTSPRRAPSDEVPSAPTPTRPLVAIDSASAMASSSLPAPAEAPTSGHAASDAPAEGAIVLRARSSLRRGDCSAAIQQLNEANAKFGAGTLRQERDALMIEALACGGRSAEASARATGFLHTYPGSPYADTIKRFAQ